MRTVLFIQETYGLARLSVLDIDAGHEIGSPTMETFERIGRAKLDLLSFWRGHMLDEIHGQHLLHDGKRAKP